MSTNNYPEGLPDIAELEKLANQFFSSLPGAFPERGKPGQYTQQPFNADSVQQYINVGSGNIPVDLAGAGSLGMGSIPSSLAGSGISPSYINVLNGVDVPHAQPFLPSPQSIGMGQVPFSVGGAGISSSAISNPNSIDLRNPQPFMPGANRIRLGAIPQSVAGSGMSPSAVNHGNAVDLKNPKTSLPDPNNTGLGNVPQSVAGSGQSPSAFNHGNEVDIKNPKTSLPDPNSTGLGNVPESVAGSGISPSAVNQGNAVDITNPQTSLHDPNSTGLGNIPESVAGSGISPSAIDQKNAVDLQNPQTSFPDPNTQNLSKAAPQPPASQYSSYLENGNAYTQFDAKTPLQSSNNYTLPTSLQHLPYYTEQPFETELLQVLQNVTTSFPDQQLPYTPPSGSGFYFLNEKNHLRTAIDSLDPAQKEFKGNKGQAFDVNRIKLDFPILQERVNGKPLIWLDNAATTQKPRQVIDRISYFYEHENSNIHRAAHELAARATDAYEEARKKVRAFLNAHSVNEIVFVRGATEAINLVAKSWGEQYLKAGDEIILSHLEHHANIVPWQQLAAKKGLKIKVIPVDDHGQVILGEYSKLLGPKTRLVSFSQVSNALGTVTPAKQIVDMAHQAGAKVLVDGAQSVSHMRVDVQALDADWFVFSGHKIFGPTGIGVLYGKEDLLNETEPWQGGGNMIKDVTFEYTQYHNAPLRFEAGTGNIADAVGLGAALDYVSKLGIDLIAQYEHYLLVYATGLLKEVPGLRLIGTAADKASVLSFVLDGYSTEQVGHVLNQEGIAVRSGHHCAQPILRRFGVESTVRPSLAFYNTCSDIDTLVLTLHQLKGTRRG
jgi:cysteine desulfurase/selenocysteine lyase